ncbi:hypothetical protein M430DRAFT_18413 [Amorphotheca resinae ATCC 22711]|uniref:Gluconokinase n=1 Tax=Amorphotheca resinae ATCC 22711 TaxID=857342 RepID=A0A2T3B3M5_AMORE|nr:hypothetical protein M430DRAFT_18413 [Amorphotheca resinae ATCC 22711]PSS20247.1 hypothetical protein M430DRAFT_18413 [Amorphotheca resinae ATCC 22711]
MLSYENRTPAATPAHTMTSTASQTRASAPAPEPEHHHIWIVTGPAGCGKSTVAKFISQALDLPFIEGDEYHPKANVDKMTRGEPLTDADRWDWLTQLREESLQRLASGAHGVVVTCSALKRKYRDVIRVAPYYARGARVHFVYLRATEDVLLARVQARRGHYMGANMVHSQFDALEEPAESETDVISVDVSAPLEDVEREALRRIRDVVLED